MVLIIQWTYGVVFWFVVILEERRICDANAPDHQGRFGGKFESRSQRIWKKAKNERAKFNISITIHGRTVIIGFSESENSDLSFEPCFINIRLLEVQIRRDIRRWACTCQNEI